MEWMLSSKAHLKKSIEITRNSINRENGVKDKIFEIDKKNQELTAIFDKTFVQDKDSLGYLTGKIFSIQMCLENTLSAFVSEVDSITDNARLKVIGEKLEALTNDLKTVAVHAVNRTSNPKRAAFFEKAEVANPDINLFPRPGDDKMSDGEKSPESVEDNDSFGTANEEEIVRNTDRLMTLEEPERRLELPAKRSNLAKVSVWRVLRDMVGRDLTHFSLPIYFLEPITMLQKVAEALEYESLLRKAVLVDDSLLRLGYVVSFFISQYANTVNRTKKPFNPIIGETYEFVTPKYKYFSEQVSHHPPISACHCESEDYQFWMHTHMKFSFWGKSLEGVPLGSLNVFLKRFGERYTITRPVSAACNIIFGKMYIDNYGESIAINQRTKEKAVIRFKRRGWFGRNYALITGTLYDSFGVPAYELFGSWIDCLSLKNLATGAVTELWHITARPPEWENYYYLSEFGYQLNYLPERLKKVLPHTDSRWRTDQKALELGDLNLAQAEKCRLEEKQRNERKRKEKLGIPHIAHYFEEQDDEVTKEKTYRFNGKYWIDREKGNWEHLPDLFQ